MRMNAWYLGFILAFFSVIPSAEAATLYMEPHNADLSRGDTIAVDIRLDTDEGECINALDAVLTYTENIQPVDVSRGQSIFSIWVEEPLIDTQNRTVSFAGGIPNGYCGRIQGDPRLTNVVATMLFRSPGLQVGTTESGKVATIAFTNQTQAFLNDGFGTAARLSTIDAQITLLDRAGSSLVNEWGDLVELDAAPPEEFSISLERSENAFDNKYFIVFNTTDKQTGVDHYEVIEEPIEALSLFRWGAVDAPWVTARSPYVLTDQSLNSVIRVRAIDKAGNEYVATLIPEESQKSMSTSDKLLIALIATSIIGFVLAFVVFYIVRGRNRKSTTIERSIKNAADND